MSYEFERHISASRQMRNDKGVAALKALQTQFEIFALAGIVPILPKEVQNNSNAIKNVHADIIVYGDDPESLSFHQALKYFRVKSNLTQRQLAEKLHMSPSQLNRIERGNRGLCQPRTVFDIIRVFGWEKGDTRANLLERKHKEAAKAKSH